MSYAKQHLEETARIVAGSGTQGRSDQMGIDRKRAVFLDRDGVINLKKLSLVGRRLEDYSLDTVKMFYNDAVQAGFAV